MVGRNFIDRAHSGEWQLDAPDRARLDLLDTAATIAYVREARPDLIVHCAGIVGGIRANMTAPFDFARQNLVMGINIVNAAVSAAVPRLLNLGSSCMYPRDAENPLKEETILAGALEPTNEGYAIAKIATARLCDYATRQFILDYKTLVPCNLYGLHDNFDAESAHLIPAVIRKIHEAVATGVRTVDIWGDGTARREFMFAGDFADFMCVAIERFADLADYTNVGLGADFSVNDYYAAVAAVIGFDGEFEHDTSKPIGVQRKLVDISRQRRLGWRPVVSLEQGVRQTYRYFLDSVVK